MKRSILIIFSFILAACATAPMPGEHLSPREREVRLLREIDRSKKLDEAQINRMIAQAKRDGSSFLEGQETEARNRSIDLYQSLLERFPENNNDYMAEAAFRLGELLFESERERIRKVIEEEGERADPMPDFHEAIDAYAAVIRRFPQHALVEDALYGLAYCYTEQGDPDRAADEYSRLVQRYPQTRYSLEINMRLGEYHFDMENLERAIIHYQKVAAADNPNYKDKALYKMGWCYYNLDEYEKAIDTFFSLLDYDLTGEAASESLADESIDIIARSFAESAGTPGLVRRLSSRSHDPRSQAILFKLADLYKERSFYPEAIGTYKTLIKLYPAGKDLPSALAHMDESYYLRGNTVAALELRESYADIVGPNTSWYSNATEENKAEIMEWILENLEASSERRRARYQAGGTESELEIALSDLALYSRLGPVTLPCQVLHLKGLTQADLKLYPDAAETLNSLAVRSDCFERTTLASLRSTDFQIEIYEVTGEMDVDLFTRTVEILEQVGAEDPATPKAVLAMGEILVNHGRHPDARTYFSRLIRDYPSSPETERARFLIGRTFFQEDNFKQAAAWFREAWRKSDNTEEGDEAKRLHVYSLFKYAEELSRQNKSTLAAQRFETIYRTFPDADVSQVSLYNAGQLYKKIGLEMKATDLFEELALTYEESDLASEALLLSVHILEALGKPVRAADDSLALANRSTGEERLAALIKSADLYSSGNAYELAAAVRETVIREFPDPIEQRSHQLFLLGNDQEAAGLWQAASNSYIQVIKLGSEKPSTPLLVENAARAQLRIAEESYARFLQVDIAPPVEESVVIKRELLQETIRNFVTAGNYRIAEISTASNYFIGSALEQFKDGILQSARPETLSPEELEEYELLLQEMAYPFEEKALQAYRINMERAIELGILDPWIQKSYQRLAELAPWAYKREEKIAYPFTVMEPPSLSLPPLPDLESVSAALDNPVMDREVSP